MARAPRCAARNRRAGPEAGAAASAIVALAAALILVASGCRDSGALEGALARERWNVVLISVDTLRADRLGCYGFGGVRTPAVDGLAAAGVRFGNCIAQTPLTLPSHATMLTGTSPLYHGVRDNGGFTAGAELVTMAEAFKTSGYETGAVVGAYVLDSKWGLDQGFDFYYDRFDTERRQGFSVADVQRRGGEVVDRAVEWLRTVRGRSFFLFLHLYDPHTPYDPPPPFREEYASDPYLGEVAYADAQVGRLREWLAAQGLAGRTILVFCADHGESLGGHAEDTHGFFVYQETVRVPLIIAFPFDGFRGLVRNETVSLADVMPTVLESAGVEVPGAVQGRSLLPLIEAGGEGSAGTTVPVYAETWYPRFHYGWNEIRSLQDGRFKLILSPDAELYDLSGDPAEGRDVAAERPEVVRELAKKMAEYERERGKGGLRAEAPNVDRATREKLAALGYLAPGASGASGGAKGSGGGEGAGGGGTGSRPSPRNRIGLFNRIASAKELSLKGRPDEAAALLREIVAEDGDAVDAYFVLGHLSSKLGRPRDAVRWFEEALKRKPDYDIVALDLAVAFIEMGQPEHGEEILKAFVARYPADPLLFQTLGQVNLEQGDYREAIMSFEACLERNPRSGPAHNSLARTYIIMGDAARAGAEAAKALEFDPGMKNLRFNLAQVHQMKGERAEAEADYLAELAAFPDNAAAAFNLGLFYRDGKNAVEEERFLKMAVEADPRLAVGHLFLGEVEAGQEGRETEAVGNLERAVGLGLDARHLRLAYYWLAKTHLRLGHAALAAEYAAKLGSDQIK